MNAPRIAPGGVRELGLPIWTFSRIAGRVTDTEPPAIFTTLGRGRGLFWGWLHFAGKLMPGGTLPRRQTELVILRVAALRDCAYEFEHHSLLGRRAGVSAEDLVRVREGSGADRWSEAEQLLMQTAEELVTTKDLSDATWERLRGAYDERGALEVVLLIGHYDMLATTLMTLRLSPDRRRSGRGR
ncbi:hypothetical protein Back2_11030 [Nocardioides baekrokdamisoli]|uniref:Carboxymuconolactone decarboxylase-like domain-containing protein n=1 Tax=Nocardioides baekrokdamisoli TaxID=1804624 RepID=A0A3G9IEN3_9ACTN|nr:carboxymuconolactone decarboxylase family protein [Nocardioides baekrokdamisoli]BBH16816.1 hypothetical protein Back2_11030 [Nocardioides baekrokdamisoli]